MQTLLNTAVPEDKLLKLFNNMWRNNQIPQNGKQELYSSYTQHDEKLIVIITE
jgi:hypothetical protein